MTRAATWLTGVRVRDRKRSSGYSYTTRVIETLVLRKIQ